LAGLLMLIGIRTIKPADLQSVWKTGLVQKVAMATTFALTMLIPLQYSVMVGVGVSLILYVVRQSNKVTIKRWNIGPGNEIIESDPPVEVPAREIVVLQPYGSLFFAAASVFETVLPVVTESSRHSVVVLRLRGRTDLGTTFMQVLARYAEALKAVDSKLVIVSTNERVEHQFAVNGIMSAIGPENVYRGNERVGATLRRAHGEAQTWIDSR
jgi:sulfate permease, SulP family